MRGLWRSPGSEGLAAKPTHGRPGPKLSGNCFWIGIQMTIAFERNDDAALVMFSGGQDSTTCLAWALERFARVETVGFDYGQRHSIELDCRERLLDGIRSLRADWAAKL